MSATLRPGEYFAGYQILCKLGAGGMGAVYQARDRDLPRFVALKLLSVPGGGEADHRVRFRREADTVARLSHPNIVTVYARGEDDDRLWIAMTFVDGSDVARALREGPLPPARAVRILAETAAWPRVRPLTPARHRDPSAPPPRAGRPHHLPQCSGFRRSPGLRRRIPGMWGSESARRQRILGGAVPPRGSLSASALVTLLAVVAYFVVRVGDGHPTVTPVTTDVAIPTTTVAQPTTVVTTTQDLPPSATEVTTVVQKTTQPQANWVEVPDVVGSPIATAKAQLEKAGFVVQEAQKVDKGRRAESRGGRFGRRGFHDHARRRRAQFVDAGELISPRRRCRLPRFRRRPWWRAG
ncbi:PASTA domain-containing protein [Nocardia yunnanensis]|uniref:non-specific serine/threonine protein kinase n=1 Tax=Nocardia yunnanensis TaxID=2382165 RepID=A0A386ZEH2_9NOCA|nr:protein kinase [Nocardia yunnanensis]AYF75920.1 PASTA domain-containing protein [Nocardia yunnanensis]